MRFRARLQPLSKPASKLWPRRFTAKLRSKPRIISIAGNAAALVARPLPALGPKAVIISPRLSISRDGVTISQIFQASPWIRPLWGASAKPKNLKNYTLRS